MRLAILTLVALAIALAAACGSDDDGAAELSPAVATPTRAVPGRTQAPATDAAPSPQPGAVVEVAGIVGALSSDGTTIEITRLSGADAHRIEITPQTQLRRAGGGSIDASEIRPSDRVVARGQLDAAGDTLLADRIEVQAVVSGGAPGG